MNSAKAYLDKNIIELKIILDDIEKEYNREKNKHSVIEKIIVDIEHEIEFDKPSGSQMVKKYKEIQTAFRLRRTYKDNVDYFIKFRETMSASGAKKSEKSLKTTKENKDKRIYGQRIKKETREEVLAEFNKMVEED